MHHVDYTHPDKVPALKLGIDRRSADYYRRLDELPPTHPYYLREWPLFQHTVWLEAGSAWLQATFINDDLIRLREDSRAAGELRPVVGSGDPAFDEAMAQGLRILGWQPVVADLMPRAT